MLIPNRQSDLSQQIRSLSYTFSYRELYILTPVTISGLVVIWYFTTVGFIWCGCGETLFTHFIWHTILCCCYLLLLLLLYRNKNRYKCIHATQVIGKHVCGNILYAFITGDTVKRSTVDIMKYTYIHSRL